MGRLCLWVGLGYRWAGFIIGVVAGAFLMGGVWAAGVALNSLPWRETSG